MPVSTHNINDYKFKQNENSVNESTCNTKSKKEINSETIKT